MPVPPATAATHPTLGWARRLLILAGVLSGLLLSLVVTDQTAQAAVASSQQLTSTQQAVPPVPPIEGPVSTTPDPNLLSDPDLINQLVDGGADGGGLLNSPISIVLVLGAISFLPALLIMGTAFTRIVIVLGFIRSALGTNGVPPNQVIIGLSLFLSLFVMAPTFGDVNEQAIKPLQAGQITTSEALTRGVEPFREFMFKQVREEDLSMFVKLSGAEQPASPKDVPTTTLVPAFVLSELRTAFLIGFVIFIPFIVIDLIVSAALSAMGMVMLPPVLISLPFKLLLFVAADGWSLVVESLMKSFQV